jgi:anti-sigma-K factor RskA
MDRMDDRLKSLLAEYRESCPDPEPGANFMPQLWQRIEANRSVSASRLLRRWAEAWLVATVAVAVLIGVFLAPRFQEPPALQASYVDVLLAADSAGDAAILSRGESE